MRSDFDYCIVKIVTRTGPNYQSDLAVDVLTKNVSYKLIHSKTASIACCSPLLQPQRYTKYATI